MAYITLANTNKIIFDSDLKGLDLEGQVYKMQIYFLSRYEESALLAIQELLKDPEKYFTTIYKPYKPKDTFSFVYEGKKPGYHQYSCCPMLNSDYQNFPIPEQIKEKGQTAVIEFREWFKTVEHLLEKPDVFVMRLKAKYGIETNPQAINKDNSGNTAIKNETIEEIETRIDGLIKNAGRFYYASDKNKKILSRFSKWTFLAYKTDPIDGNETGYSDEEVRKLLKEYDETYKRPLKSNLIEYYRLKFNPEIKMEGYFLEKLGFKSCGHCYRDDYEPKETEPEKNNDNSKGLSDDLPF
jgi:hypothetical protein